MPDIIKVKILDGGVIKAETDKISAANHANAEAFIKMLQQLAGGPVKKEHKHGATGHVHSHDHEHGEEHEHH